MLGQYRLLAQVIATLLALLGSFCFGWYVNGLRHENAALEASSASAIKAKATEAEWSKQVYRLAYRLRTEQEAADNDENRVATGLLDGTIKLQPRLTCVSRSVPAASGGDGSEERGFKPADAVVALGIAGDGDQIARQLAACQAYVRQIRGER